TIEIINGKARKITPLTPLKRGIEGIINKRQIGRGESILTRADKERIKADAKHLDQISREHLTARLASDPKIPTHIEMFGKTYTFYEGFVAYTELRMRLKREAAAR